MPKVGSGGNTNVPWSVSVQWGEPGPCEVMSGDTQNNFSSFLTETQTLILFQHVVLFYCYFLVPGKPQIRDGVVVTVELLPHLPDVLQLYIECIGCSELDLGITLAKLQLAVGHILHFTSSIQIDVGTSVVC